MVIWFFKPNIQKLKEKKDIEGLSKALKNKDPQIRQQAIGALLDLYVFDKSRMPPISKALPELRRNYANIIAEGGVEAVPFILGSFYWGKIDEEEAEEFLLALGSDINSKLLERVNSQALLYWIEQGPNTRDAREFEVVLKVLTKKGDRRLIDLVIKSIEEIKSNWFGKHFLSLIITLSDPLRYFEAKKAIPLLRELLRIGMEKGEYSVVTEVVLSLIKLGGIERQEAIALLKTALKDSRDSPDCYYAAKALQKLEYEPEDVEEKVFMFWARHEKDKIVQMGTTALAALLKLLQKGSVEVVTLVEEIGDKRAVPYLVEMLNKKSLEDWLRRGNLGDAFTIMRALHKLGWRPEEHWHKVLYFTALKDWNGLIQSCEDILPADRKPISLEDIYKSSDPNDAIILRDIIIYCEVHQYEHNEENDPVRTFCYYEREKALTALFNLVTSTKHELPLNCLETLTAFESHAPFSYWLDKKDSYTFHYFAARQKPKG
jgi:HEAT repeat protein